MISKEALNAAKEEPVSVISSADAGKLLDRVPSWVASSIDDDVRRFDILKGANAFSGDVTVYTTIDPEIQEIAKTALRHTIEEIGGKGPAGTVALPGLSYGDSLENEVISGVRNSAAQYMATSRTVGRAIVHSTNQNIARVIIDRGYGDLEWAETPFSLAELDYQPRPGDVLPYTRENGQPVLQSTPQIQGAVVIMAPETGAILASVGGYDASISPFDRTRAMRQPGSSIKPFLWLKALESGIQFDDLVMDAEVTYTTPGGVLWRPRNYDGKQSGPIPLFVGLEESSNLVAAHLVARLGIGAMAEITEAAGIYEPGTMKFHPSSSLGVSETTLNQLT
ncbi:unnamed protein product, partial [Laminaria digitata]